jgi:hypothetical protein
MTTRVGLALAVMMAVALAPVRQGRIEQMRSLVQAIPATGKPAPCMTAGRAAAALPADSAVRRPA